jgi:acyl-coenzyme A synthetase/AMP-(fatty) acid ligase/acyl carrier protein
VHVDDADVAGPPPALPAVDGSAAAYVISTSGSSGTPKPVVVEHASLLAYLDALARRIDLAGRTALVVSSPAHDLGYTTLWSALTTGGTLVLADRDAATDPDLLTDLCRRHPVDVLKIAPTHLEALLHGGQDGFLPGEHLVLGGEPLRWPLVDQVRRARPELTVWNHYGPTETTVGATLYRTADPDPWHDRPTVPIGTALNGPVRVAGNGELLVSGPGLARGYLGLPAETDARFRWDDRRTRWYHTGDLVTELPTGDLEFLGRDDDQVVVRGHRVELGAVDVALGGVPGVLAAASCLVGEGGGARLVAGAVLAPTATPRAVLAELAATLPGELVPALVVALPRLPRTAAGKLDRAALAGLVATPPDGRPSAGGADGARPERLADMTRIWSDVLENGSVAPEDNFFDLGGHSIHAIKIVARVRQGFGRRVPVRMLFELLTPQALYEYVTGEPDDDNGRTGH